MAQRPVPFPQDSDELPLERRGLPLGLRILAGTGAAAFLLIGVNTLIVGIGLLSAPPTPERPRADGHHGGTANPIPAPADLGRSASPR